MDKFLKIGVDIRDLKIAKTGTKTYLEEICNAFKKLDQSKYKFYFLDTRIPVYTGENKLLKLIEHFRYQLWKQLFLPLLAWYNGCDVVFCTDNFAPIIKLGYKTVPVFHDAFFFEDPSHYNKIWLWLYKKLAIPAALNSHALIVPTNYVKERVLHFTRIDERKLHVVYEGPKTFQTEHLNDQITLLDSFGLKPKKYILHVGVMNKRKNIPALIIAFKKLIDDGLIDQKLVLTGNKNSKKHSNDYLSISQTIHQFNLENHVVFTGYITDMELGVIYKSALFYVFPSLNEGFGIPILESFKHEIPVLVADNTCLPEVGGDAVLTFNPFSENDLYHKMKLLVNDENLRKDLINKGIVRLRAFSWHKTVLKLLPIFESSSQKC